MSHSEIEVYRNPQLNANVHAHSDVMFLILHTLGVEDQSPESIISTMRQVVTWVKSATHVTINFNFNFNFNFNSSTTANESVSVKTHKSPAGVDFDVDFNLS